MTRQPASNGALAKGCLLVTFLGAVCGIGGVGAFLAAAPTSERSVPDVAVPDVARPAEVRVAPGPGGAALERIRANGVLRVAMDSGEPPFTGTPPMYFPSPDGLPDGFDVALARRIAGAVGVADLKVVHAKYSGLEDKLRSPDVDLLISGYSPTDADGIVFSDPYLEYGLCLVVPTRSAVHTTADLFGKKIGIFDDDAAAEDVQRLVKGYTELVRLEDGYWDQLVAGRFDAFLYDYPYTVAELNVWTTANPSRKGSLRIAQYNLTDSAYAVGVRATEPELLELVNATIREWRASPAYADAVRAYLKGGLAVEPPKGAKVHRVVVGDTLSGIAAAELGSVDQWTRLWELNRERFPNPHLIEVGDEVVLP